MDMKPGEGYDWKKTVKKFTQGLGYTVIVGVLTAVVGHLEGLEGLSAQESVYAGLAISSILALHNLLKHYKDK